MLVSFAEWGEHGKLNRQSFFYSGDICDTLSGCLTIYRAGNAAQQVVVTISQAINLLVINLPARAFG